MSNKKIQRATAIKAEKEKRAAERLSRSPVNREQMVCLISQVGEMIVQTGLVSHLSLTDSWLVENGIDVNNMHDFLRSINIENDWDLLMKGDPYELFGQTNLRKSWMPLEESELTRLIDFVDELVRKDGCHHDHRHSKEWLSKTNCNSNRVIAALMAHGGFCDCEVVLNVDGDSIYPR